MFNRTALVLSILFASPLMAAPVDFEIAIRPLLTKHCYSCHGPEKQKSGLRLDDPESILKGGDLGKAIIPGKSAESPLLRFIRGEEKGMEMPPKGDRLTAPEVETIRAWIDQGAKIPASERKIATATDWWSLKPLVRPEIPKLAEHPIDAFIQQKLQQQGLTGSPRADRRTLIRRVSIDLTGLPPTYEAIEAFANDPDPAAYVKLVDRLLASPQYGERWARHWLDIVHFGETHGYDKDQPRPNAWPYRDYVIRAFNEDRPYWKFVQEQIAGDRLFPGTRDGIEGLGLLAAGPWDFIGHAEVPESKIDGKIARHLDRDDMVSTVIGTFNSMTIHCAQCHTHKFDPIPHEDYYRLQAVFAAIDRTDARYDLDPKVAVQRKLLEIQKQSLTAKLKELEDAIAKEAGPELQRIDQLIVTANKPKSGGIPAEYGYHSALETNADRSKWVQIDLGERLPIQQIQLFPCYDDFNNIGAGFGFPVRFKVEASDDPEFRKNVILLVDRTKAEVPNPGIQPIATVLPASITARYVRLTASKLALRSNDYMLAMAEMTILDDHGMNRSQGKVVTALDSIEAAPRWRKSNLTDGLAPSDVKQVGLNLNELKQKRAALLAKVKPELHQNLAEIKSKLLQNQQQQSTLPAQQFAYVGSIHNGSGTFTGTGSNGGKPRPIFVLPRGDVKRPGKEVEPGALRSIPGVNGEFGLTKEQPEADRRAKLAEWLTDRNHPLTWRSIVNRVWLYHFGRGIVDTPNDFGRMGQLPTHPELLDWLAIQFRDGSQSIKSLHRLIVTSETYCQASSGNAANDVKDASNQYYWRQNRRRLEAEAIRDRILLAADRLHLQMGGPSFRDFVIEHPQHSPHYEYHLHDANDPASHRRSVYRFIVRSQTQPWLTTFDCADPSIQVEKRNSTVTPLQALSLMNHDLMLVMSQQTAKQIQATSANLQQQVRLAFVQILAREPNEEEAQQLLAFTRKNGLAPLCRLLMNLNEFIFVD
jgi:hypothetical protein